MRITFTFTAEEQKIIIGTLLHKDTDPSQSLGQKLLLKSLIQRFQAAKEAESKNLNNANKAWTV